MSVSILILTLNEERNLPECLRSVRWCDDVVVLDSFSTDRTVEIARSVGARVVQRHFDDYGSHREAARTMIQYKYPWVFALDADETPDEQLVEELLDLARSINPGPVAYRMRRKDFFMGRWIKHSTLYPSWFVRFYQPDKITYDGHTVHEYPTAQGQVGEVEGHLIHHSFNKGFGEWFRKHVRYAELEAKDNLSLAHTSRVDWAGLMMFHDPVRRRRALKAIPIYLPLRPMCRFLYMYLLRRGFLDGAAGFTYCCLLATYEYMIVLNMRELCLREQELRF